MTEKKTQHSPPRMALPPAAVKRLAEAGIRCTPEVALEYQKAASRYVLRGRESGGAVKALGRYVSFCADDGQPLPWFIRPDSLTPNGDHAIVIGTLALVSIEIFRFEHTYELLILRHAIIEGEKGKRPAVSSTLVFRGWQGQLPLDLVGKDKPQAGKIAPEFFDRSGEPRELPAAFVEAVRAITRAVNCVDCSHPHFLTAKPAAAVTSHIVLPDRKHSFASGGGGSVSTGPEVEAAVAAARAEVEQDNVDRLEVVVTVVAEKAEQPEPVTAAVA